MNISKALDVEVQFNVNVINRKIIANKVDLRTTINKIRQGNDSFTEEEVKQIFGIKDQISSEKLEMEAHLDLNRVPHYKIENVLPNSQEELVFLKMNKESLEMDLQVIADIIEFNYATCLLLNNTMLNSLESESIKLGSKKEALFLKSYKTV